MPKFIEMPHGYAFDIEQLLYYRISYGDTWLDEHESIVHNESLLKEWRKRKHPVKLFLHFKNGSKLEIPDFERYFIDDWFYPALREIESGMITGKEEKIGNVYFIQGTLTRLIKIGYTTNVEKRVKSLEHSEELEILHVIPNVTRKKEKELHEKFKHLRKRNEWFKPEKDLLDYIKSQQVDFD